MNKWGPGLPLPGGAGSGKDQGAEFSQEDDVDDNDDDDRRDEERVCPFCQETFEPGNKLSFHYDAEHSVRDPDTVTDLATM